jgi:mercuric ion transport protein
MRDFATRLDGRSSTWALGMAAIAALLASSCCLVPLVLVSIGLSGAWLSNLRTLQPYSPIFVGIAIGGLALAARSLFRAPASCRLDGGLPRSFQKSLFWAIAVLTLLLLVVPVVAPWFY